MVLTGPVDMSPIELNSNEWPVQACPNFKWEIPEPDMCLLHIDAGVTLSLDICTKIVVSITSSSMSLT